MFCCLRLLNGVGSGQFIVCELFTFLIYFAVFVYSKVYAKPSVSRDEFFALINFNGKVNYQFASRKSGMFHNGHSFLSLFLANQCRFYNVAKLLASNVDRNRSFC